MDALGTAGEKSPAVMCSYSLMSAVGAFPQANITGFPRFAARSTEAAARVVPLSFAASAVSGSDMKHSASQPSLASAVLFIPAFAMLVSVTMTAPFFSSSSAASTAFSEKQRLSA